MAADTARFETNSSQISAERHITTPGFESGRSVYGTIFNMRITNVLV